MKAKKKIFINIIPEYVYGGGRIVIVTGDREDVQAQLFEIYGIRFFNGDERSLFIECMYYQNRYYYLFVDANDLDRTEDINEFISHEMAVYIVKIGASAPYEYSCN